MNFRIYSEEKDDEPVFYLKLDATVDGAVRLQAVEKEGRVLYNLLRISEDGLYLYGGIGEASGLPVTPKGQLKVIA